MADEIAYPLCALNSFDSPAACLRPDDGGNSLAEKPTHGATIMPSETGRLTRAIVDGDESAFGEFYDLYSGRLYGLLLVLASGQEEVARDLHQLVMVKVARKFRTFETDSELWAWLAQIARNAFVDYVRKQARCPERTGGETTPDWAQPQPDAAGQDLLEWLEEGLQTLDDEERSLVEAVYFENRAQKDVATEYGQTGKAVESKMARIRANLRAFILTKTRHERRTR